MSKKIKVFHSFLNKKNEHKRVEFYLDEQLYKGILTLSEEEKNKWLEYYYYEYNADRYDERKEFKNRDKFITADQEEQEDEEEIVVSKKKLSQIADNTCNEQALYNKLIVEEMMNLLNEDEKYIFTQVYMFQRSIISVAKQMNIDESTVRKKIRNSKDKIQKNYKI